MPEQYTVQKGDNLYNIAKKKEVSFNELKAKNTYLRARKPPYRIHPGDKLALPPKKLGKTAVGATTQPCPYCKAEELSIQSSDTKSTSQPRTVDLVKLAQTGQGPTVLQVIASSYKADTLTFNVKGKCKNGKPAKSGDSAKCEVDVRPNSQSACPTVFVAGHAVQVDQPSPAKVNIYASRTDPCNEDFVDFFKRVLVPNSYPETYAVSTRTCSRKAGTQVIVQAFPESAWNGKISVGYSYGTYKDSNFVQNQGWKKLKVEGEWGLEGKLDVKYDNRKWTLGGSATAQGGHQKNNALTRQLFGGAQAFLNKVAPMLGDINSDYGKIKILWPKLELSGGVKNKEKDFKVLTEGNVKVAFTPFIGASGETDILNWLLRVAGDAAGGFGALLVKIKKRAATGYKGDLVSAKANVSILLTLAGKVEGALEWKSDGSGNWNPSGEVAAKLSFEIKGEASAEGTIWIFKAGAGANLGAKTEVGGKLLGASSDKGPSLKGQLFFSGITVYYAYYYEVGSSATSSTKLRSKPKGSLKDETTKEYVVVDPAEWPRDTKPRPLKDGSV
ncbi:LysM peptidoglycan-binding domain-containing protein [Pyxidicoccus sp. 3LFB2]